MRKLISSINITLDGFCDHTAVIADDELHENANELFRSADTILFGRVTYQLMESAWPQVVKNPTGNRPMDEFAVLIDNISKIVFSNTLHNVQWKNTRLVKGDNNFKEAVIKIKALPGKNIIAGSPSLINQFMRLNLVDEYRFCVQPIVLGHGLRLFNNIGNKANLKLIGTKTFGSGVVMFYYEPADKKHLN